MNNLTGNREEIEERTSFSSIPKKEKGTTIGQTGFIQPSMRDSVFFVSETAFTLAVKAHMAS